MGQSAAAVVLTASLGVCLACGSTTSPSTSTPQTNDVTIGFGSLTINGAPVTTYGESGFTISAMSADWVALTTYGNPPPFIEFLLPGGSTATGEVQIRTSGPAFYFKSVDLYSSTTPIPYTITGLRASSAVFTLKDTVPNTFGTFRTVTNPNASTAIDVLSIVLTNAAAPCCSNPMGLDTIALAR